MKPLPLRPTGSANGGQPGETGNVLEGGDTKGRTPREREAVAKGGAIRNEHVAMPPLAPINLQGRCSPSSVRCGPELGRSRGT
jgi:hypothetical protein